MNRTVEVNGTTYDARTPRRVIDILEESRMSKRRLVLTYGNVLTGSTEGWGSATPMRGHIGRSTGTSKIPLLIRTRQSDGGEGVLDGCIVQIVESKGGRVLYQRVQPVVLEWHGNL